VRRMIIEDQLDRRIRRIGGVEELEEFDELATAVSIFNQSASPSYGQGAYAEPAESWNRAGNAMFFDRHDGRDQGTSL